MNAFMLFTEINKPLYGNFILHFFKYSLFFIIFLMAFMALNITVSPIHTRYAYIKGAGFTVVRIKCTIIIVYLLSQKWVSSMKRVREMEKKKENESRTGIIIRCVYVWIHYYCVSHLFVNTCPYSFDNVHSTSQAIKST